MESASTSSLLFRRHGPLAITAGYYLAFIALGLAQAALGPTLPALAQQTGVQIAQISILFTARSLGYIIGSLQGGRLFDRWPGHPLLVAMLLAITAVLLLVPLAPLLWLLALVLLILGIAESMIDVGSNTLLVWLHGSKVAPFMNGLHFFFGLGAFLSPIIIAQAVLLSGDIRWAFWALALLPLPAVLWLARLPSPAIQNGADDAAAVPTDFRMVSLILSLFFLYVGAEISVGGWVFTYAVELNLASATMAAYLTSAFWGALTAGRLLSIPLAARLRPQTILLADLLGCVGSAAIIVVWPASSTALWLGTLGMGFFMASIFPTLLTFAERRMAISGRITGWFLFGASAGAMVLPWLVGQLFERIGPQVTFVIVGIDLVIALAVFVSLMLSAPAPRPQPETP